MFPIEDLGIRNAMRQLYDDEDLTRAEMIGIAERWRPYRAIACMYLWEEFG